MRTLEMYNMDDTFYNETWLESELTLTDQNLKT